MKVTALIPVKGFGNAKQRLSALLASAQREMLAEAMFRDVLRQVLQARGLAETVVVTGDDHVAVIAQALGAKVLRETTERGETDAVDFARADLKIAGCEAVLIIPGDMPLVRSADIELVLAQIPAGHTAPFALLVPSHDRLGTNALLLAPPDIIKLRFGYDSFSFHLNQVAALGLPVRFINNDHIALDIDEPKDLERFLVCATDDSDALQTARRFIAERRAQPSRRVGEA
ncbi:MAG: 2-phospho-L-lactate guanylyltransferase [Deltaproteobacteria bacterium]|nr:2-phospho-L-lactate guanylyltransferase [Deltaproteobacteria bacterium]